MKIDSLYESLLEEGMSSVVFHATQIGSAAKIIASNKFINSPITINSIDRELNAGKLYFLSTARSKSSSYIREAFNPSGVSFKLDGRMLSARHKVKSVDYFSTDPYISANERRAMTEMEDRIVTNDPIITNIIKYILEVEILIPAKVLGGYVNNDVVHIKWILEKCASYGIPVYIYTELKDLVSGNKNKNINDLFIRKFVDLDHNDERSTTQRNQNTTYADDRIIALKKIIQGITAYNKNQPVSTDVVNAFTVFDRNQLSYISKIPAAKKYTSYIAKMAADANRNKPPSTDPYDAYSYMIKVWVMLSNRNNQ
ncbi:hypothetical protein [Alishewanella phage vB_AspM_Slickus01]|nr:hypothetical protein [Alishewanella phage vB_AspM_Slickus01]